MVHEDHWNRIKAEFSQVCRHHFGRSLGEPGTPKELNASEILQGKGFFSSWPKARRLQIVDDLLNILVRRETPLIVSYVNKNEFASARDTDSGRQHWWRGPWEPIFSRFVFSLDIYMDELNMAAMPEDELSSGAPVRIKERAAIIADEAKRTDSRFMEEFLKTEMDLPTGAVLENIHFARSEDSHCTQLADMCAYFVRRHLHQPSRPNPQYTSLEQGHVLQVIYPVQL